MILQPCFSSSKQVFPAAERNKTFILEILQKYFDPNRSRNAVEIASGTGQHISYFAAHFPKITFQPSECDQQLLNSIKAYADETPTKNVKYPIRFDVRDDPKVLGDEKQFDYMINVNMIHVSPYECTEALFRDAAFLLKPKGVLITYGAYAHNGVITPQSNIDFDKNLRMQNPEWGLRDINDIEKIANAFGIELLKIYDLPANNKCLAWKKL